MELFDCSSSLLSSGMSSFLFSKDCSVVFLLDLFHKSVVSCNSCESLSLHFGEMCRELCCGGCLLLLRDSFLFNGSSFPSGSRLVGSKSVSSCSSGGTFGESQFGLFSSHLFNELLLMFKCGSSVPFSLGSKIFQS